jgi:hypothetical protein
MRIARLFLITTAVGLFSSAAFAQTDGHYRHARHHRAAVTAVVPSNAEAYVAEAPQGRCHVVPWTTWDFPAQNFTACDW